MSRRRSLCAQASPDAWFPPAWNQGADAKAICRNCPVRMECLQYALDNDEKWGIYGGLSAQDREKLRHGQNPMRGPGRPWPRRVVA